LNVIGAYVAAIQQNLPFLMRSNEATRLLPRAPCDKGMSRNLFLTHLWNFRDPCPSPNWAGFLIHGQGISHF
jgi:hypothetical protein